MRLRTIAIAIAVLALLWGFVALAPRYDADLTAADHREEPGSTAPSKRALPQAVPARTAVPALPKVDHRAASFAPMPPIGTRLATIHETLQRQALNGDVRAACRLAFELKRCAGLPGLRQFVAQIRAREADPETPAILRDGEGKAERFFGGLAQRAEVACAGFPHEETANAWKWQIAAALAGYPPSMARFAAASVFGPKDAAQDSGAAYRDHAAELLQRAIDAGEPIAFEMAMHAHLRGESFGSFQLPQDPVRSAGYALALRAVASPAYEAYFPLEDFQRSLGPARYAEAQRLARELSVKLAHVAPGSVDFTNGTQGRDDGSHCDRAPD
jgi:hypothetical protein